MRDFAAYEYRFCPTKSSFRKGGMFCGIFTKSRKYLHQATHAVFLIELLSFLDHRCHTRTDDCDRFPHDEDIRLRNYKFNRFSEKRQRYPTKCHRGAVKRHFSRATSRKRFWLIGNQFCEIREYRFSKLTNMKIIKILLLKIKNPVFQVVKSDEWFFFALRMF